MWCRHSPGLACRLSISYSICGGAARRLFAIQSVRGSPDWSSALISLPKSHSTRRIESVVPSIKRYDANLPTMNCANRLAPARSSRLAAQACRQCAQCNRRHTSNRHLPLPQLIGCCDPCAAATSEYHQVTRRQVLGGSRAARKLCGLRASPDSA